jgi:hypothetical protein
MDGANVFLMNYLASNGGVNIRHGTHRAALLDLL